MEVTPAVRFFHLCSGARSFKLGRGLSRRVVASRSSHYHPDL
jgi:hypothetical protein